MTHTPHPKDVRVFAKAVEAGLMRHTNLVIRLLHWLYVKRFGSSIKLYKLIAAEFPDTMDAMVKQLCYHMENRGFNSGEQERIKAIIVGAA